MVRQPFKRAAEAEPDQSTGRDGMQNTPERAAETRVNLHRQYDPRDRRVVHTIPDLSGDIGPAAQPAGKETNDGDVEEEAVPPGALDLEPYDGTPAKRPLMECWPPMDNEQQPSASRPPCPVTWGVSGPCHFDRLPDELLLNICTKLLERDLCRLACVSRRFNRISNDQFIWSNLYRSVFEYEVPLFHASPRAFFVWPLDKWKCSNPWKKSFEMLRHGIHVRPGFSAILTEQSRSRRLFVFETFSAALMHAESLEDPLIFLHSGVYNMQLNICRNLRIVGAAPRNVNTCVVVQHSEGTVIRFAQGSQEAYLGYVGVRCVPDPNRAIIHAYAVEVTQNCSPVIENCTLRCKCLTGSALCVWGRNANPTVRHCKVTDCHSVGLCIADYAKGIFEYNEIARNTLAGVWVKSYGAPTFKKCAVHSGNDVGLFIFEHGQGYFDKCDIYNNQISGVEIKQCGNPTIMCCHIHNGKTGGVYIHEHGKGHIQDCLIYGNSFAGIWISMGSNPTVRGNKIFDGRQGGVYIFGEGRGVIEGNDIYGNALAGIQIRTGSDPIVRYNRIHHGQHGGIYVHEKGKGLIEYNEVYENTLAGIWVTTGSVPVMRYNRIHSGRQVGIYFYDNGNGVLEENEIYDHQYSGIQIRTGSSPLVLRNKIWGGQDAGVLIYSGGEGLLEENEIFNNAMAGVWIKTNSRPVLRRNKIFDSRDAGICVYSQGGGTLEDNEIFRNAQAGILIATDSNPTVRRNNIHDGYGAGVEISSGGRGVLIGNCIHGNRLRGIAMASNASTIMADNKVYNNFNLVERTVISGQCLFRLCKDMEYPMHDYFRCLTCAEKDSICINCAKKCHANHKVEFVSHGRFYCDCGAGTLVRPCQLQKQQVGDDAALEEQGAQPSKGMASSSSDTDGS